MNDQTRAPVAVVVQSLIADNPSRLDTAVEVATVLSPLLPNGFDTELTIKFVTAGSFRMTGDPVA